MGAQMIGELASYFVAACWLAVAMWHSSDSMRDMEEDYIRQRRGAYLKSIRREAARGT